MTDRSGRKVFWLGLILLIFSGIFFSGCAAVSAFLNVNVPDLVECRLSDRDTDYTFGEYDLLRARLTGTEYRWTAFSESERKVSSFQIDGDRYCKVVTCDAEYQFLYQPELVRGSFFEMTSGVDADPYCVIDEKLAALLWSEEDPIGQFVLLDENAYQVCGVVRRPDTLMMKTFRDSEYIAYVPYGCELGWRGQAAQTVSFHLAQPEKWTTLTDLINELTGSTLCHDVTIRNYTEERALAVQYEQLIRTFLLFILLVTLIAVSIRILARGVRSVRSDLSAHYLGHALRKRWLRNLGILFAAAAALGGAALVSANLSAPYIPQRYICFENIFRLRYYVESWAADAARVSLEPVRFDAYPARLLLVGERMELLFFAAGCILFLISFILILCTARTSLRFLAVLNALPLSLLLGASFCGLFDLKAASPFILLLCIAAPFLTVGAERLILYFLPSREKKPGGARKNVDSGK